ncbi:hypothetical protein [Janthinobacterium sp. RB2P8]|uniref:hypothetical protein n=1 Tax=Janthinobacterium sp. RB2P8 TaxID=3424191 RepID=UPI003F1F863D
MQVLQSIRAGLATYARAFHCCLPAQFTARPATRYTALRWSRFFAGAAEWKNLKLSKPERFPTVSAGNAGGNQAGRRKAKLIMRGMTPGYPCAMLNLMLLEDEAVLRQELTEFLGDCGYA